MGHEETGCKQMLTKEMLLQYGFESLALCDIMNEK